MLFPKTRISRSYNNIIRYKQIIAVLIRHGFHEFVETSQLLKMLNIKRPLVTQSKYAQKRNAVTSHWKRIRLVLEELGPTFIKLGQFVSNRPDFIPKELCQELEKLLDNVAPFDGDEAVRIIQKEIGKDINDIFLTFHKAPFSAASISQVHEAYLKDNTKVAVKVQRPGINKTVASDIEIMFQIAKLIKKHVDGADIIDPIGIVEEFKEGITHELDFENEIINIEKFNHFFKDNIDIKTVKAYKEFSSKTILTMEYIDGVKFSELSEDKNPEVDFGLITTKLANLVLMQIFDYGYFHADPHSGNLIIFDNKICFIDFGLMGILPPKHKGYLAEMIIGLVEHDPERITDALIRVSLDKEIDNRNLLESQVFKIIEQYSYLPLEDINIGHFLRDLLNLIVQNKLKIPTDIYLLLKTLISLEGTVRRLQPKFDMLTQIEPYVKKLLFKTMSPSFLFGEMLKSTTDYAKLFCEIPKEFRSILYQIKNKTLKMQFEHKGLEPIMDKHDQIANRLSFSIITASLLIGSALILHAGIPPRFHGVSVVGIFTFLFSVFMGCMLLISIIKHGKM